MVTDGSLTPVVAALAVFAFSWLLTYLVHSTVLLGSAWLFTRGLPARAAGFGDTMWKGALLGGILTASLQTFAGVEPFAGRLTLPGTVMPMMTEAQPTREAQATHEASPTHETQPTREASPVDATAPARGSAATLGTPVTPPAASTSPVTPAPRASAPSGAEAEAPERVEPARRAAAPRRAAPARPASEPSRTVPTERFRPQHLQEPSADLAAAVSPLAVRKPPKSTRTPGRVEREASRAARAELRERLGGTGWVARHVPHAGESLDATAASMGIVSRVEALAARALGWLADRWLLVLMGGWLLVALARVGWLGAQRLYLSHVLRDRRVVAEPPLSALLADLVARGGVGHQPIRLTMSARLAGPISFGRSEICVPDRALDELDERQQRSMLAHELGHIVRRDPTWLLICALVERILFFQPLNALARRRIQEGAEYLCDDYAVALTGERLSLATCLARVATWVEEPQHATFASSMASRPSALLRRVENLRSQRRPYALVRPAAALVVSLLVVSVGVAAPGIAPHREVTSGAEDTARAEDVASTVSGVPGATPAGLEAVEPVHPVVARLTEVPWTETPASPVVGTPERIESGDPELRETAAGILVADELEVIESDGELVVKVNGEVVPDDRIRRRGRELLVLAPNGDMLVYRPGDATPSDREPACEPCERDRTEPYRPAGIGAHSTSFTPVTPAFIRAASGVAGIPVSSRSGGIIVGDEESHRLHEREVRELREQLENLRTEVHDELAARYGDDADALAEEWSVYARELSRELARASEQYAVDWDAYGEALEEYLAGLPMEELSESVAELGEEYAELSEEYADEIRRHVARTLRRHGYSAAGGHGHHDHDYDYDYDYDYDFEHDFDFDFDFDDMDWDWDDDRYREPLLRAAAAGDIDRLRELIDEGADLAQADRRGVTALHVAAGRHEIDVVELLLDAGADVNAADARDRTPLHVAADDGDVDILRVLIERGADVSASDRRDVTALHVAADENEWEIAEILIEAGAVVDARDGRDRTPLWYAAAEESYDCVISLLDAGADANAADRRGQTPLHAAADEGAIDAVLELLDRGADPTLADDRGDTPLDVAEEEDHDYIAEILSEHERSAR